MKPIQYPDKKKYIADVFTDTRYWDKFQFRDDDVIISSYHKAGTTWMQQIVAQLIFGGAEGINVSELSPWLDMRIMPIDKTISKLEKQEHPRIIKTHSPAHAIPIAKKAKYILITRDGRDIVMSMFNHFLNATDEFYELMNEGIPKNWTHLARPAGGPQQYFSEWLNSDGKPVGSFWDYMKSWKDIQDLPNVLLVHYNNLKKDLRGEIERIAEFLSVNIMELNMEKIVFHCSFDHMKERPELFAPVGERFWRPGTFFHKGTNNRWEGVIKKSDSKRYEQILEEIMGPEFAHWIKTGEDK